MRSPPVDDGDEGDEEIDGADEDERKLLPRFEDNDNIRDDRDRV